MNGSWLCSGGLTDVVTNVPLREPEYDTIATVSFGNADAAYAALGTRASLPASVTSAPTFNTEY